MTEPEEIHRMMKQETKFYVAGMLLALVGGIVGGEIFFYFRHDPDPVHTELKLPESETVATGVLVQPIGSTVAISTTTIPAEELKAEQIKWAMDSTLIQIQKAENQFTFDPKPDITVQELALLLPYFLRDGYEGKLTFFMTAKAIENARPIMRHLRREGKQ